MATWLYYPPEGGIPLENEEGAFRAVDVHTVGPREFALIERAREAGLVLHSSNAERCALSRLKRRGLMDNSRLGPPGGIVVSWRLTGRGRRVWLRVRKG
jgi:hypothetical protein